MRTIHLDYSTLKCIRIVWQELNKWMFIRLSIQSLLFIAKCTLKVSFHSDVVRESCSNILSAVIFWLKLLFLEISCYCIHPSNIPKRTSDKNDTVTSKKRKTITFLCTYSIMLCKWYNFYFYVRYILGFVNDIFYETAMSTI